MFEDEQQPPSFFDPDTKSAAMANAVSETVIMETMSGGMGAASPGNAAGNAASSARTVQSALAAQQMLAALGAGD